MLIGFTDRSRRGVEDRGRKGTDGVVAAAISLADLRE
jgi:hypothetical protein